jgi:hypothetical protein
MKKIILFLMAAVLTIGCQNDDTDFSEYINGTTPTTSNHIVNIVYNGTNVTVTGDTKGYVTTNGADVIVNTGTDTDSLLLVLSGSTTNGSLLVYRESKFGIQLNGVNIHHANGPAINNQCSKSLYLHVADGTTNTLTDGTAYTEQEYDQKGALFSEGQMIFLGTGSLSVTGNCKHAIACDDYIIIDENVKLQATSTTGNGIKVNDGLWINNGTLDINVTADGARGIRCENVVEITGGTTTITTSGNCVYDDDADEYSSAACIKCDLDFTMSGGTLTMTSSGDGGKGINSSAKVLFSGGTLSAITTGDNENGKPKAIKATTGIVVSGGSFTAKVDKSWACDSGYGDDTTTDAEKLANCVTVVGTPKTSSINKKSVVITY